MDHPALEALLDQAGGKSVPGGAAIERHLAACASCRAIFEEARERARVAAAAPTVRETAPGETAETLSSGPGPLYADEEGEVTDRSRAPREGALIDRYLIEKRLGRGGMGEVYAAVDQELGRRVAIKLLLPTSSGRGQEALLAEARAMARLSHRNVVPVFDAGTHGARVFVAMELIEGGTLGDWLRAKQRSWREIVARMIEAGRGLAAAHAQGIVHRDFKPANVLVPREGEARVADFGIARVREAGEETSKPGKVKGTPEYMSPEQMEGRALDGRSDQFSFAVALYELLYGARPFAAGERGLAGLRDAILARRFVEPTAERRRAVPPFLRAIVLRGLAADRGDRFPDMAAMLAALARDPARRWRRLGLAALALGAAGAIAWAWLWSSAQPVRACGGAGEKIAAVWGPAQRAELERAFLASGARNAAASWAATAKALDGYASAWSAARTEACEATALRHQQSDELLDLRMQCLDDGLVDLSARLSVLARADAALVQDAASQPISPLAACSDPIALRERRPLPAEPAKRAEVVALRARLANLSALLQAGRYADASAQIESLAGDAAKAGDRSLMASVGRLRGGLLLQSGKQAEAETALRAAAADAEAGRDDLEAARAWLLLASNLLYAQNQRAAATLALAGAAIDRSGARATDLREQAAETAAELAGEERQYDAALAHAREAVALADASGDPRLMSNARVAAGQAAEAGGNFTEAIQRYGSALAAEEKRSGKEHPRYAFVESQLGDAMMIEREARAARPHLEHALAVEIAFNGSDSRVAGEYAAQLAHAEAELGDAAHALPLLERVGAQVDGGAFEDDDRLQRVLIDLSSAARRLDRIADEVRWTRRYAELSLRLNGPDSEAASAADLLLGQLALEAGRLREAKPLLESGLALITRHAGEQHQARASGLQLLARLALEENRPRDALDFALQAGKVDPIDPASHLDSVALEARARLALHRAGEARDSLRPVLDEALLREDGLAVAEASFVLAQAGWELGDRPGARARAEQARAAWSTDRGSAKELREVTRWLAAHH